MHSVARVKTICKTVGRVEHRRTIVSKCRKSTNVVTMSHDTRWRPCNVIITWSSRDASSVRRWRHSVADAVAKSFGESVVVSYFYVITNSCPVGNDLYGEPALFDSFTIYCAIITFHFLLFDTWMTHVPSWPRMTLDDLCWPTRRDVSMKYFKWNISICFVFFEIFQWPKNKTNKKKH